MPRSRYALTLVLAVVSACEARGFQPTGPTADVPATSDVTTTDAPVVSDAAEDASAITDVPPAQDIPPPPVDAPVTEDVPPPPVDVPPAMDVPPPPVDVPVTPDVPPAMDVPPPPVDVPPAMDVPPADPSAQIAAVRAASGAVDLPVTDAVVTYTVAATLRTDGSVAPNDPPGFFVQADRLGPALFVAVDPATLSPAPTPGDRVRFRVTRVGGPVPQLGPWAQSITGYTRTATGVSRAGLTQTWSGTGNLASNVTAYEHELGSTTVTVTGAFAYGGIGFVQAPISTASIDTTMALRLRVRESLQTSLGLREGCRLTVTAPLWRYDLTTQVAVWSSGDVSAVSCPPLDAGVDAGPPPPDRVWVLRVGDGVTPLSGAANPLTLEVYDGASGVASRAPIALPTVMSGSNRPITLSGVATAEGSLSRSLDGRYLTLAGYTAAPGTPSVSGSAATRVIARVDASGTVDTRTTMGSAADLAAVRAAVSVDGSAFWTVHSSGGSGFIGYSPYGGGTTVNVSNSIVLRGLAVHGGRLYATGSNPDASGLYATTSLPTGASATVSPQPGFPTSNTLSPYNLVVFDRDGDGAAETVFFADDRAPLGGGGLYAWSRVGSTWSSLGQVTNLTTGLRGLAGRVEGAGYVFYGVTAEGRASLVRIDVSATLEGTVTLIATAPALTSYRGVSLGP